MPLATTKPYKQSVKACCSHLNFRLSDSFLRWENFSSKSIKFGGLTGKIDIFSIHIFVGNMQLIAEKCNFLPESFNPLYTIQY